MSSDTARKHNESLWPSDPQVPVPIPRTRSIAFACSYWKEDRVDLVINANYFTILPSPQGSQVVPTAELLPRRPPRKEHHVAPHAALLVEELRRKIPKRSDISHQNQAQSLKSWIMRLNHQQNPVPHPKKTSLSLSPMTAFVPTSREHEIFLDRRMKIRRPVRQFNPIDVRSAAHELNALNATILKPKTDPALDDTKRRTIIDTGSGAHIVGRPNVHNKRHSMIRTDGHPLKLNTANGQLDSTRCFSIGSSSFNLPIEACVLDNSPDVLSVGKLCNDGWSLKWNARKTPTLTSPDGLVIHLKVRCFVPYLDECDKLLISTPKLTLNTNLDSKPFRRLKSRQRAPRLMGRWIRFRFHQLI